MCVPLNNEYFPILLNNEYLPILLNNEYLPITIMNLGKELSNLTVNIIYLKPRPEAHMDMIFFLSVFEEHRLDSTTTDITTALYSASQ